jgi:hypothetical protein
MESRERGGSRPGLVNIYPLDTLIDPSSFYVSIRMGETTTTFPFTLLAWNGLGDWAVEPRPVDVLPSASTVRGFCSETGQSFFVGEYGGNMQIWAFIYMRMNDPEEKSDEIEIRLVGYDEEDQQYDICGLKASYAAVQSGEPVSFTFDLGTAYWEWFEEEIAASTISFLRVYRNITAIRQVTSIDRAGAQHRHLVAIAGGAVYTLAGNGVQQAIATVMLDDGETLLTEDDEEIVFGSSVSYASGFGSGVHSMAEHGGRLYIATAAVAASGAGTATIAIAPPLRAAVVVGEPLILSLPSVPMRLVSDDEAANPTRPGPFAAVTIRLEEAV